MSGLFTLNFEMNTHANELMGASVIGEGKSNVILKIDEYWPGKVIRLCKRFSYVSSNNEYLTKNKGFQSRFNREFKGIADYSANTEYIEVDKNTDFKLFYMIREVLKEKLVEIDEDRIMIIILTNYLNFSVTEIVQVDYYTKIYNNFMAEFKPKWAKMNLLEYKKCINYPTINQIDKQIPFCRNCNHVIDSKPQVYCYNGCKGLGSIRFFKGFLTYLNKPNNIVQRIYQLQRQLIQIVAEDEDIDMFYLNALIALRDISIFYNIKTEEESIIDLDYKDINSVAVYHQKMQKEWGYLD